MSDLGDRKGGRGAPADSSGAFDLNDAYRIFDPQSNNNNNKSDPKPSQFAQPGSETRRPQAASPSLQSASAPAPGTAPTTTLPRDTRMLDAAIVDFTESLREFFGAKADQTKQTQVRIQQAADRKLQIKKEEKDHKDALTDASKIRLYALRQAVKVIASECGRDVSDWWVATPDKESLAMAGSLDVDFEKAWEPYVSGQLLGQM